MVVQIGGFRAGLRGQGSKQVTPVDQPFGHHDVTQRRVDPPLQVQGVLQIAGRYLALLHKKAADGRMGHR